jgi:hypothetical protein
MSFTLKRIRWPGDDDAAPHDFRVMHQDKAVGRIYRRNSREQSWNWSIYGDGSGLADTLERAKAAFKSAWEGVER